MVRPDSIRFLRMFFPVSAGFNQPNLPLSESMIVDSVSLACDRCGSPRAKFAMDGDMKRKTLALLLGYLVFSGCAAGRVNTDLLQARIREQAVQLSESEREIARTRSELKRMRIEAERLQTELSQNSGDAKPLERQTTQVRGIHIHSLASGGLNKDDQPGDDAVVIQFVPIDVDEEPIRVPGDVEFRLTDPQSSESEQEIGRWTFSTAECRDHWTRGITSSGYQFTLPLQTSPQHSNLVLHLSFRTPDERQFDVSQVVKVVPSVGTVLRTTGKTRSTPLRTVPESEEILPPVGEEHPSRDADQDSDWSASETERNAVPRGRALLHSANWTDATIPQLR